MRKAPVLTILLLATATFAQGQDLAARLKADAQDARQGLAALFVRVGHTFQRIGLDVGHGAKEAGLTVGHGAKEGGLAVGAEAKKVGHAVADGAVAVGQGTKKKLKKVGQTIQEAVP